MKEYLRLDKYLADLGIGTRTEVKAYIKKGRVTVNEERITVPDKKINRTADRICFDGVEQSYEEFEYYMLNKPAGVVSATEDRYCETVIDLIRESGRKDLFPVGRLDKDTEGLLLITNDGNLAHGLLSPKKHVSKVYYAHVQGIVTDEEVELFRKGICLEDFKTMPAELEILKAGGTGESDDIMEGGAKVIDSQRLIGGKSLDAEEISEIRLTIYEGKFHQVKRMFGAAGMKVIFLRRLQMGSLVLDEALGTGDYRPLTDDEIMKLKNIK